ncbi:hypothetical protein QYE76_066343 [Lolium multiflorum]|uniref:Retrotransposon gag domain-containing protein n=1 Tax=Lolium multiflorum TaxID=4521 RepID=A0AAD8SC28_LOLMU|nr:hypothetical protein QYE76_066343 [Lolium multiflorum]
MEPYVQTETYDLENGGSLVFERDLYLVSERLERPPPKFHGVRIHNTPAGEQQWMITADLKGSSEPPISERILFSFKAYSWVDGLAHALQEGLARVCGQNIAALRGSRFAHFARHDTMGEPMALSSHPVLKIHVQHLDFMLHETRKDLELTRVHSHRAQMALAHHADAIRLLAKDRRSLRLQRAKNVATINRLREKIRTLEVTVRTQQDQIQEMEEDGEDIQGGNDFLSDDTTLRMTSSPMRKTTSFWRLQKMGSFPSMWMKTLRNSFTSFTYVGMAPPNRNANQDAMMQLLQTMMADREAERAERQANLAALQQIAQNNQGHGNHDHPGSKLKNFQNTNPPMFSKTEEPLDADDWLQTIENNLEVAGVEAAEKVLFATHYLSGPARAWWTSARAMNAGQMMTWEDFKLKFSKYHVPQGLIKKMRDEFRELKQGRMSVVEYRDRFLTLSRYAPDETDTNEKRKESFLNGLHDEMQTVLVNIPFADLEAVNTRVFKSGCPIISYIAIPGRLFLRDIIPSKQLVRAGCADRVGATCRRLITRRSGTSDRERWIKKQINGWRVSSSPARFRRTQSASRGSESLPGRCRSLARCSEKWWSTRNSLVKWRRSGRLQSTQSFRGLRRTRARNSSSSGEL